MTSKEVIEMIADYFGVGVSQKAAKNHYNYCIKHNLLPDLKGGGRTQT